MSQASKRRKSTPQTRAGQYMCPQCGKVFETKKEVDQHINKKHGRTLKTLYNTLHES